METYVLLSLLPTAAIHNLAEATKIYSDVVVTVLPSETEQDRAVAAALYTENAMYVNSTDVEVDADADAYRRNAEAAMQRGEVVVRISSYGDSYTAAMQSASSLLTIAHGLNLSRN